MSSWRAAIESMSSVPMGGLVFAADPTLAVEHPDVYIGMGLTAENVAEQYNVSREDQDAFAVQSHQRAAAAIHGRKICGRDRAGAGEREPGGENGK